MAHTIKMTPNIKSNLNESESSGYSSASESSGKIIRNGRCEKMQFGNSCALRNSLRSIGDLPDLCDVKLSVGESKVPVYGVRSLLVTRSRIMYQLVLSQEKKLIEKKKRRCGSIIRKLHHRRASHTKHQETDGKLCIPITEYDVDVFRKLITFIHSGSAEIDSFTVIGLMAAAAEFGFADLQSACLEFAHRFLSDACAFDLLKQTQKYDNRKCVQKIQKVVHKYIRERHNHFTETPEDIVTQYHQDSPYCDDRKHTSDKVNVNDCWSDDMDRYSTDSPSLDCGFLDDGDEHRDDFDSRSCVSQMALLAIL